MAGSSTSDLRRRLRRIRRPAWLGISRQTRPVSARWGRDRGTPVDRFFIQDFLERHRSRVTGSVVELLDDQYTLRYGAGVTHSDVLDIDAANPRATVLADLTRADGMASDTYDCFILTQTLHYIFEPAAAIEQVHRVLKPGGSLLCTVPTVSRIESPQLENEYWRFTPVALRRLLEEAFPGGEVELTAYGNVLAAIGFLRGVAAEELERRALDVRDAYFPVLVAARATKAAA